MRKWRRSLRKKRDLFPERYDDPLIFELRSMRELTRHLVAHYGYSDMDLYFDGYRITGNRLATLSVPSLALVAADDPIIPVEDFAELAQPDALQVVRTEHGGHCGYIDSLTGETYADRTMVDWFARHT